MAVCASVFRRRCTFDAQCWVNWQLEWSHLVPGPLVMRIFIGLHNLERHFQVLYLPTKLASFGMGRFLFVLFLASRKYWSRNSNNDSRCLSTCLLLLCHSIIVLSSCLFFYYVLRFCWPLLPMHRLDNQYVLRQKKPDLVSPSCYDSSHSRETVFRVIVAQLIPWSQSGHL